MFYTIRSCLSITALLFIVYAAQAQAGKQLEAVQRCLAPTAQESILSIQDFKWGLSAQQNLDKEAEIYQSGKRLPYRTYFDRKQKSFVIPFTHLGRSSTVKITQEFIVSVRNHIEEGLRNRYSEAIIFSDMGHSHLYFPDDHWEREYKTFVRENQISEVYEKMLADPKLQVLYHTAEQLQLKVDGQIVNDSWLQWRYHSRNIIGGMGAKHPLRVLFAHEDEHYNTVRKIKGLQRWSAGFNISASKDGCFVYRVNGEKRYFDISLMSLPYFDNRNVKPHSSQVVKASITQKAKPIHIKRF